MYKFLIADDYEHVRKGIASILKEEFSDAYIGHAADTNELLKQSLSAEWDVIICDINMPGGSGLEALVTLRKERPLQPIVMVSIHDKALFETKVIAKGANAYISKEKIDEELIPEIRKLIVPHR